MFIWYNKYKYQHPREIWRMNSQAGTRHHFQMEVLLQVSSTNIRALKTLVVCGCSLQTEVCSLVCCVVLGGEAVGWVALCKSLLSIPKWHTISPGIHIKNATYPTTSFVQVPFLCKRKLEEPG